MQFRVKLPLSGQDTTYDPASGAPLRGGSNQGPVIVRLANPATGTLAAGVTLSVTRQLVLFEYESPISAGGNTAGMPVEDMVNNTKWTGRRDGGGNHPSRRQEGYIRPDHVPDRGPGWAPRRSGSSST